MLRYIQIFAAASAAGRKRLPGWQIRVSGSDRDSGQHHQPEPLRPEPDNTSNLAGVIRYHNHDLSVHMGLASGKWVS